MATVYLGHDLRHDRPVALKVLHPELAATLGPERFLREIKLAARLQHPHILSVHDSGEGGESGLLWFTMPYIEGENAARAAHQGEAAAGGGGAAYIALALDPLNVAALQQSAMLRLAQGDLPGARAALRRAPREVEPPALVAYVATYWDLAWLLDQEHQALLLRLTPAPFGDDRGDWGLALAQAHALRGDSSRARAYADSANVSFEGELRDSPDDYGTRIARALDLAYLGRTGRCGEGG